MRRRLFIAFAALATLNLGGCVSTSPPYRAATGEASDVGPGLNAYTQATVPHNGLIVVEGDILAYGLVLHGKERRGGATQYDRAKRPFPETLGRLLGVHVENRGQVGQTLAEGERLFADKPCGDLLVLAYGYADALGGVKRDEFSAALEKRIAEAHARGAAVILLSPPHFRSKRLDRAADIERAAFKAAQTSDGVGLVDLAPMFVKISPHPTSGAYQSEPAYSSVAYAVAAYIAVAPEGQSAGLRRP